MARNKFTPFAENISESAAACLFTMVQGNLLSITLGHWIIAAETGLVAGTLTAAAILISKSDRRWLIALLLGTVTAIVDFIIHPGNFGSVVTEAIVTGIGAGALSYIAGSTYRYLRNRRAATRLAAGGDPSD